MSLSFSELQKSAEPLGLDPCAVQAALSVESSGSGFLQDGRPKILFEGHVFWKELQKRGINPEPYAVKLTDIEYPAWDKSKYSGGAAEWERLNAAALINRPAALCSASWGLFQIMGFDYALCDFGSVETFVDAQEESEAVQLESFCAFIRSRGLARFLAKKDWANFAKQYNGSGYAANQYDVKLRRAYERCKGRAQ